MKRIFWVLLLGMAGCATTRDEHIIPFNAQQRQALFARARPPQAFGLTVYTTERGPLFAGAHRVHSGQAARLPFASKADPGTPMIRFTARSVKEIPALIDTTARENWIIPPLAAGADLVMMAGPNPYETKAVHVYDEIGGFAALLHKAMFDKLHMENVVFYVRGASGPLGPPARWSQDPVPQAVFGVPFLRAFSYVTFDFAGQGLVLSATTPYPGPDESRLIAQLPLLDIRGVLGVEGTLNGEPTTFLIDTGGDFDLVKNDPKDATVRRVAVGDLVFPRDIEVKTARELGLGDIDYPRIGRGLLTRYRVTLDFRNKQVIFERPATR
ncbi:MAG TPA: hypothetical protein PKE12_11635 [Kiritimatiellia bacterium]|nr:hypothetical protein [Kiritimatiellia bacterium]